MELVEGAAVLIASGRQSPRWYYPGNVFGPRTVERWLADVAELEAERASADARKRELDAIEQRSRDEREAARNAPAPKIADLRLRRLAADLIGSLRDRQDSVVASEHGSAEVGPTDTAAGTARAAGEAS